LFAKSASIVTFVEKRNNPQSGASLIPNFHPPNSTPSIKKKTEITVTPHPKTGEFVMHTEPKSASIATKPIPKLEPTTILEEISDVNSTAPTTAVSTPKKNKIDPTESINSTPGTEWKITVLEVPEVIEVPKEEVKPEEVKPKIEEKSIKKPLTVNTRTSQLLLKPSSANKENTATPSNKSTKKRNDTPIPPKNGFKAPLAIKTTKDLNQMRRQTVAL